MRGGGCWGNGGGDVSREGVVVVGAGWVCWLFGGSAGVAGLSDGVRLLSLDDSLAADSTHTHTHTERDNIILLQ